MSRQKPINDNIPTPDWLIRPFLKAGFFDPYILGSDNVREPPQGADIFANGGFSKSDQVVEDCIRWHQEGHYVALLMPIESSTRRAKRLIQYGCKRMYFERRVWPGCRGVELIILTGDSDV